MGILIDNQPHLAVILYWCHLPWHAHHIPSGERAREPHGEMVDEAVAAADRGWR